MDAFKKHLAQYDLQKLENALQTIMKKLVRQYRIQYEFGPEYMEYSAQKAAVILKQTDLKPLSEIFTQEQLSEIPVDNKVSKNYF